MATPDRHPINDFLSDYPRSTPLHRACVRWCKETWWFLQNSLTPVERALPAAAREVTLPDPPPKDDDLKRSLESMRKLVDAAEARATLLRTKATSLLGIVTLVTTFLSWWLVSGHDRLAPALPWVAWLAHGLMALTAICLALAFLAMFRTQRVVAVPALTLEYLVDLQTGKLRANDPAAEVRTLASAWGGIERWSDVVADYLRAAQRFLGLSLAFAIAAGFIARLHPEPVKNPDTIIQASGNPAIQTGAASITVAQTSSAAPGDVLITSIISMLVGAGIVLLAIYCYRKWPSAETK